MINSLYAIYIRRMFPLSHKRKTYQRFIMRMQKIIFSIFSLFILAQEAYAGITTSASFGFGRYRNENATRDTSQPVGWTWGLAAGYRYQFASLEGMLFKYSGCAENEYHFVKYDTCASNTLYGVLGRIYFQDVIDLIVGYGFHNITHKVTPNNSTVAQHFHYDDPNKSNGLAYGLGGKMNIAPGFEAFFDVIIFSIGNGGDRTSSELDLFVAGIRADF